MKHFLHLLRHELLRLKWPLLCWLGLLLMELSVHAWQVFGPVGKDWPQQSGFPILAPLLYITLLFLTAALFLEHMAKHLALWTIGTYFIATPIAGFAFANFYVETIGDWHLAALALAPPVIALHYLTRRPWPKIATSIWSSSKTASSGCSACDW